MTNHTYCQSQVRRTFPGWLTAPSLAVLVPRGPARSASSSTCPKKMMLGSMLWGDPWLKKVRTFFRFKKYIFYILFSMKNQKWCTVLLRACQSNRWQYNLNLIEYQSVYKQHDRRWGCESVHHESSIFTYLKRCVCVPMATFFFFFKSQCIIQRHWRWVFSHCCMHLISIE